MAFSTEDFRSEALLERILTALNNIEARLKCLEKLEEFMASNPTPVSQATFDTALAAVNSTLSSLFTVLTSIGQGLSNLEASLSAAQGSTTPVDLSGELATIQNLQTQATQALTNAQNELAAIPAVDQPTTTVPNTGAINSSPTPNVTKPLPPAA